MGNDNVASIAAYFGSKGVKSADGQFADLLKKAKPIQEILNSAAKVSGKLTAQYDRDIPTAENLATDRRESEIRKAQYNANRSVAGKLYYGYIEPALDALATLPPTMGGPEFGMIAGSLGGLTKVAGATKAVEASSGFVESIGFKISQRYFERLLQSGRGDYPVGIITREVMEAGQYAPQIVTYATRPGQEFYYYKAAMDGGIKGFDVIVNPATKEIYHFAPLKDVAKGVPK